MAEVKPEAYIEVRIEVPRELTDAVSNFIIDHIAGGLILEEEEESEKTGIIFYIPGNDDRDYKTRLTNYFSALNDVLHDMPPIRERLIKNIDWIEKYKSLIGPVTITEDVVVRPTWSEPDEKVPFEIILEPKMAFGTGSHETTRSCLRLIRGHFETGMRFLDLGSGSGILSILADKMGAVYIKAVDYDPVAVDNTRENFAINGVKTEHEVILGKIDKCDNDKPYDFICANIIKSTILPILVRLLELTVPKGKLVLSGLLDTDEKDIEAALEDLNQNDYSILHDNQWSTYLVTKG